MSMWKGILKYCVHLSNIINMSYAQKYFYSDLLIPNDGYNDFSLNFRLYSPWDSSTFDIQHIVVKSHGWKILINKNGHIYHLL